MHVIQTVGRFPDRDDAERQDRQHERDEETQGDEEGGEGSVAAEPGRETKSAAAKGRMTSQTRTSATTRSASSMERADPFAAFAISSPGRA